MYGPLNLWGTFVLITAGQRDSVVNVLAKQLQSIDVYRSQIEIETDDLGTTIDVRTGYQPSLDDILKRWRVDPVGTGLRQGIREIGAIVAPHVTKEELLDICDDACERSENADWSQAIINHMWDGLVTSDGWTWTA